MSSGYFCGKKKKKKRVMDLVDLLSFPDLSLHVLRYLDAPSFGSLSLSSRSLSAVLSSSSDLFRRLLLSGPPVRLLPGESYAERFLSCRPRLLLGLEQQSSGEMVPLNARSDSPSHSLSRKVFSSALLTSSPDARLVSSASDGTVSVWRATRFSLPLLAAVDWGGPVVYMMFDPSSSVLSWIGVVRPALSLFFLDLAAPGPPRTLRFPEVIGSPLFWSLTASLCLAHTQDQTMVLRFDDVSAKTVIFDFPRSSAHFQVPLFLCSDSHNQSPFAAVVAASPAPGTLSLLRLSLETRSPEQSLAALRDPANFLHEFRSEGPVHVSGRRALDCGSVQRGAFSDSHCRH